MNSFRVRGGQAWNSIPNWIKLASNAAEFKNILSYNLNIASVSVNVATDENSLI